jgi:hypothetical protein
VLPLLLLLLLLLPPVSMVLLLCRPCHRRLLLLSLSSLPLSLWHACMHTYMRLRVIELRAPRRTSARTHVPHART